jgi:hypothetical protein
VTIGIPKRNMMEQTATVNLPLCGRNSSDQLSTIPVMKASTRQKPLSIPRSWKHTVKRRSRALMNCKRLTTSMMKKVAAQKGAPGSFNTTSG